MLISKSRGSFNGFPWHNENTKTPRKAFTASHPTARLLIWSYFPLPGTALVCSISCCWLSPSGRPFPTHQSPLCSLCPRFYHPTCCRRASQFPSQFLSLSLDFCHLSHVWGYLQPSEHLSTDPAQCRAQNWLRIIISYVEFKDDGSLTLFAANLNILWRFLLENGKITFQWLTQDSEGANPAWLSCKWLLLLLVPD